MTESKTGGLGNKVAGLVVGLEADVGASARVEDFYGGVRVVILDPATFPWRKVLEKLVERQHEVWIRKGKQGIEIISQALAP